MMLRFDRGSSPARVDRPEGGRRIEDVQCEGADGSYLPFLCQLPEHVTGRGLRIRLSEIGNLSRSPILTLAR
jgi:hypothetical protein